MDTVTIIIIIILLIIGGIFIGTQIGGGSVQKSVNPDIYSSQQYGGACGR